MFTWICPRCGREVPPSYNECPDCTAVQTAPEPKPAANAAQPEFSRPAARPTRIKQEEKDLPGWLLSILFALGFVALGSGGFYAYKHFSAPPGSAIRPPQFEKPAPPPLPTPKTNLVARYVEVTGIRLTEDANKKTQVQCLVVNHSAADIADLAGTVTLKPRSEKPDEKPIGTFSFRVPSIGPYESREVRAALDTALRTYELPDWQFLVADVQLSTP